VSFFFSFFLCARAALFFAHIYRKRPSRLFFFFPPPAWLLSGWMVLLERCRSSLFCSGNPMQCSMSACSFRPPFPCPAMCDTLRVSSPLVLLLSPFSPKLIVSRHLPLPPPPRGFGTLEKVNSVTSLNGMFVIRFQLLFPPFHAVMQILSSGKPPIDRNRFVFSAVIKHPELPKALFLVGISCPLSLFFCPNKKSSVTALFLAPRGPLYS